MSLAFTWESFTGCVIRSNPAVLFHRVPPSLWPLGRNVFVEWLAVTYKVTLRQISIGMVFFSTLFFLCPLAARCCEFMGSVLTRDLDLHPWWLWQRSDQWLAQSVAKDQSCSSRSGTTVFPNTFPHQMAFPVLYIIWHETFNPDIPCKGIASFWVPYFFNYS